MNIIFLPVLGRPFQKMRVEANLPTICTFMICGSAVLSIHVAELLILGSRTVCRMETPPLQPFENDHDMHDLTGQMAANYQIHPSFKFEAGAWRVPEELLAAFSQTYGVARQMRGLLSNSSFAAVRRDCVRALDDIFLSMQTQCADEFEPLFLVELKGECDRLLAEELTWCGKRPHGHFVRLEAGRARSDAMLLQSGRHFFGQLPLDGVDELRALASNELGQFRANAASGKLKREDLSINTGPTVSAIRSVLNREFKALGVLDAVSAYSGRKTRVVGVALELSVPHATWWKNAIGGLKRPPRTLYAHVDESIVYPKSIVYLSDVTEQNGPTGCYPGAYDALGLNPLQEIVGRVVNNVGARPDSPLKDYYAKQYHQSMGSENFRRHFMRLPESLRFNSHMGWDVMPESELEHQLADCERQMTGPAGTFVVFDGARLLHRGGLMQEGERLALQVIFSDFTFTERIVGKVKRMLS